MTKAQKARVRMLVKALRSGKYRQTQNTLRTEKDGDRAKLGDKFCCLGVACDVYRKEVGGKWKVEYGDVIFVPPGVDDDLREDLDTATLPETVRKWFGFKTVDPDLKVLVSELEHFEDGYWPVSPKKSKFAKLSATEANDTYRFTFKQIADAFERKYLSK